jgi:hypothetical protein
MFKKRDLIDVLLVGSLFFAVYGCSLFGGSSVKPVSELETELELLKKEVDKSVMELQNVQGDVEVYKQNYSTLQSTVSSMQTQITQTVQYNESIKSIAWTAFGIYVCLKILAGIQAFVIAKAKKGSTIKNLFRGNK